jgi:small subunit ribosomal protein S5
MTSRFNNNTGDFLFEKVININRCSKVVKGGRKFSFSALVIVGNCNGEMGVGFGKANEIPNTIKKATNKAKKNTFKVKVGNSIPHTVTGHKDGSYVTLKPAYLGVGIRACQPLKNVFNSLGIKNVLTKSFGSTNPLTLVQAAIIALKKLSYPEDIKKLRSL